MTTGTDRFEREHVKCPATIVGTTELSVYSLYLLKSYIMAALINIRILDSIFYRKDLPFKAQHD